MGLGLVLCPLARAGQSVTLGWNASPVASVAGYMISYGSDGINFGNQVDAGENTTWTVSGLQDGSTNYFEVSAYDANFNESPPSAPIEYIAPVPIIQTVAVAANPAGAGSVSGGGSFDRGSSVTVTAAANSGYTFVNWTENGAVQSGSASYNFTLAANRNLVANFTANPILCTVAARAGANGNISPGAPQTVVSGGSVTFTATPAGNYVVQEWLVNGREVQTGGATYTLRNVSGTSAVTVAFVHSAKTDVITSNALTVLVSGNGAVTPNLSGRLPTVGRRYTLQAHAGAGWVFSNWTSNGVAVPGGAAQSFLMTPGLVLQANFVTNPFTAVAGTYEGLFYDTNNAAQQSSGFCKATVTSSGGFTAKLQLGSESLAFSGQFTVGGQSFNTIARKGSAPLTVQLQLGLSTGGLTGQVRGSNWTAELAAGAVTCPGGNSGPQAGKYTLVIPGVGGSSTQPGGDGFGSVTVGASGNVSFSGVLADGTPTTSAAMITGQGLWPFYAPLYGGKGSVIGWLAFDTDGGISGQLDWIKPAQPGARYYSAGFTNCTEAIGSAYRPVNGAPALGFSSGQLTLAGGNLPGSFTEQIEFGEQNQSTKLEQSNTAFTVAASSGVLTGRVVDPQTGQSVAVKGIVLQNQQIAAGFFLGTSQSGQAVITAGP
jgi:hypothetical protein